ncbi:hypothetical protein [Fibrivirga algicola]|nr:hypothetical protein [Fibrivirga algicola]
MNLSLEIKPGNRVKVALTNKYGQAISYHASVSASMNGQLT